MSANPNSSVELQRLSQSIIDASESELRAGSVKFQIEVDHLERLNSFNADQIEILDSLVGPIKDDHLKISRIGKNDIYRLLWHYII